MFTDRKRIARVVIFLFALLTALAAFMALGFERRLQPGFGVSAEQQALLVSIGQHGITADLNQRLAALPKQKNWVALFVVERQGADFDPTSDPIVAASLPDLVGKTNQQFTDGYGYGPGSRRPTGWGDSVTSAPGGKNYMLWTMYMYDGFWIKVWAATAAVAAGIAWLGLTAWVYFDAREATAVAGWLLLTLLTGPVAVAVWLISRPSRGDAPGTNICPGCGSDTTTDATFCVHCGFALCPACPDCRRTVGTDWTYCATCGSSLTE